MEKWQEEAVKKSLSKFNVVKGKNLPKQIYQEKRDCYSDLADYVTSTDLKYFGKICALYGLRRTGKTVMMYQCIANLDPEIQEQSVYIFCKEPCDMLELEYVMDDLYEQGFRYFFIDEITRVEDLQAYGNVLSDYFITIGTKVVIASGRPLSSVSSFANESGASKYVICGNGALLYDTENNEILYDKSIERKKALEIIKICEENSIFYSIYTENLTIAKSLNYNILFFNNENKKMPDSKKTSIKIMDDIYKYVEENKNVNVLKITICDENKVIFGGIIRKLRAVKNIDVLDVQHMARKVITLGTEEKAVEYHYTEIANADVNKWNAIEKLAEKLNINKEEIATIGDNMNDKQMIENAGLGVIMENSAPYMKEFADVVTASNNEDGVAKAIEKYILEEN